MFMKTSNNAKNGKKYSSIKNKFPPRYGMNKSENYLKFQHHFFSANGNWSFHTVLYDLCQISNIFYYN